MFRYVALSAALLVVPAFVEAHPIDAVADAERVRAVVSALQRTLPKLTVEIDERTGLPASLKGLEAGRPSGPKLTPAEERDKAEDLVREFFQSSRGRNLFLLEAPVEQVRVLNSRRDSTLPNAYLVRVQQMVGPMRVFGAQALASVKPSVGVSSVESLFASVPELPSAPTLNAEQALSAATEERQRLMQNLPDGALAAAAAEQPSRQPELLVFDPHVFGLPATDARLAWLVRVGGLQVFVDATDGQVLHAYLDLHSSRQRLTHDLQMADPALQGCPGALVLNERGAVLPGPGSDALAAHAATGAAYDYFHDVFGRDSYDDDGSVGSGGAAVCSYVRRPGLANAFWDPDRYRMVYGPGYAEALDIVAHEYTHAVTQFSAGLLYDGEAGALNEAFSDVFGVLIEARQKKAVPDWTIGESLPGHASPNAPERSLRAPHNGGFDRDKAFARGSNAGQPEHYSELVLPGHAICATTTDALNRCVHFNSGIFNKAVQLLCEGGTHAGVTVKGIGVTVAERILYRTLTAKLTASANLKAAAVAMGSACDEMAGVPGSTVSRPHCVEVRAALAAVGLQ